MQAAKVALMARRTVLDHILRSTSLQLEGYEAQERALLERLAPSTQLSIPQGPALRSVLTWAAGIPLPDADNGETPHNRTVAPAQQVAEPGWPGAPLAGSPGGCMAVRAIGLSNAVLADIVEEAPAEELEQPGPLSLMQPTSARARPGGAQLHVAAPAASEGSPEVLGESGQAPEVAPAPQAAPRDADMLAALRARAISQISKTHPAASGEAQPHAQADTPAAMMQDIARAEQGLQRASGSAPAASAGQPTALRQEPYSPTYSPGPGADEPPAGRAQAGRLQAWARVKADRLLDVPMPAPASSTVEAGAPAAAHHALVPPAVPAAACCHPAWLPGQQS